MTYLLLSMVGCGDVAPRQPDSRRSEQRSEPIPDSSLQVSVSDTSNPTGGSPQTVLYSSTKGGVPAEFEEINAVYLGGTELLMFHSRTLVDIVAALDGKVPIICIVTYHHQEEEILQCLEDANVTTVNLTVTTAPSMGMWVRDYGPTFVRHEDGHLVALDALYDREGYEDDDHLPLYIAGFLRIPIISIPIRMEGGNLLSDGCGTLFTTEIAITENRGRGFDENEIGQILRHDYGGDNVYIYRSLENDDTRHIDMFMTILKPDLAVLAEVDPAFDPVNSERLNGIADHLSNVQTEYGQMRVERIPMRSPSNGFWRSYTNVVFANGTLLVPIYPDTSPDMDARALAIYSELLPDWRIVPIDASTLARRGGSLRCVTLTAPDR